MKLPGFFVLVVVLIVGCKEEAPSYDNVQIKNEVEDALWAFHEADTSRNAQGVIDLLWPEYSMLADGRRILYADVVAGSPQFMAGLSLFYTEWSDVQTLVLGPDVAVTSFVFRDSLVAKTGEITKNRGPNTFVWQKRAGEWRVLYGDADHYPITDSL